jgi:hypothetical protein
MAVSSAVTLAKPEDYPSPSRAANLNKWGQVRLIVMHRINATFNRAIVVSNGKLWCARTMAGGFR